MGICRPKPTAPRPRPKPKTIFTALCFIADLAYELVNWL